MIGILRTGDADRSCILRQAVDARFSKRIRMTATLTQSRPGRSVSKAWRKPVMEGCNVSLSGDLRQRGRALITESNAVILPQGARTTIGSAARPSIWLRLGDEHVEIDLNTVTFRHSGHDSREHYRLLLVQFAARAALHTAKSPLAVTKHQGVSNGRTSASQSVGAPRQLPCLLPIPGSALHANVVATQVIGRVISTLPDICRSEERPECGIP